MNKRLIVILTLMFVAGVTFAAFAAVQNVKVGGDLTIYGVDRNALDFKKSSSADRMSPQGFVSNARIRIDANLTDNVDVTLRLLNERVWGTLDTDTSTKDNIDIDLAYATMKDFLKDAIQVPVTLIIGRQNILLGDGLLVGASGTNQSNTTTLPTGLGDLSTRASFDAILAVADLSPVTFIAAFGKGYSGTITRRKDDINLYVLNAALDTGVLNTIAELTYVGQIQNKVASGANEANNFGARVTSTPIENLGVRAEVVYQAQRGKTGNTLRADGKMASDYAVRLGANLGLPKVIWMPSIGVDYMLLSRNWNTIQEAITPAALTNLIFPNSNMQVIGATLGLKPTTDTMLKVRYANLRSATKYQNGDTFSSTGTSKSYTMTSSAQLGNELDVGATYNYTEDVQFGLDLGMLKPGKAFDKVNRNTATQVIGSMKVTF